MGQEGGHWQPKIETHFKDNNDNIFKIIKDWNLTGEEKEKNKKILNHIFITNKKNIADDFFYSEIADFIVNNKEDRSYFEYVVKKITVNSKKIQIYIILSSARVSSDIFTDDILNCFNDRMAFKVNSEKESKKYLM